MFRALPVVSEALEKIGSYMTGTIIPAAETAVKWISEHRTLILALAAGIATAVAAYKAYKVAITAYNAVMPCIKWSPQQAPRAPLPWRVP